MRKEEWVWVFHEWKRSEEWGGRVEGNGYKKKMKYEQFMGVYEADPEKNK